MQIQYHNFKDQQRKKNYKVTISPKIFYRENKSIALYSSTHFMWGLRLGLGLSCDISVRVGVR